MEDTKDIIERCNNAKERAKRSQVQSNDLVRVGISLYQSGQPILDLCQKYFLHGTGLSIQFVPVADTYESYRSTLEHLGEEVDVIASINLPEEDAQNCNMEVLDNPPLCLAIALDHELAKSDVIDVSELEGKRIGKRRGIPACYSAIRRPDLRALGHSP